jgi:hypothetical protein
VNTFGDEMRELRNPGLCAYLLWRYAIGYQEGNAEQAASPSTMAFYVLPLMLHRDIADVICSTQVASGLHKALAKVKSGHRAARVDKPAEKVKKQGGSTQSDEDAGPDALLAVDGAVVDFRELTCKALFTAVQCRLLTFSDDRLRCVGVDCDILLPSLPDSVERLGAGATKLGAWFARLSMQEVTQALKVEP